MKKIFCFLTILIMLALVGCSVNVGNMGSGNSDHSDNNPGMEGYVVGKESGRILVVNPVPQDFSATGGIDEFYRAIWFSNVPEEIKIGEKVQVWFDIVADSYPGQSEAKRTKVIEVENPGNAELSEAEAIRKALSSDEFDENGLTVIQSVNYDATSDIWEIQIKQEKEEFNVRVSVENIDVKNIEGNLHSILSNEMDQTKYYQGYAEYGHNETLKEIKAEGEETLYLFEGIMTDGSGLTDENGNPISFRRTYTVTDEMIKSELTSAYLDHVSTSIFQEKILLKKPLRLKNTWVENVDYNGKTHEAVSTIVLLDQGDNGEKVYEVETVIENIVGFTDEIYKEKIRLEEGKGVVFFQNTMKGLKDPLDEEGYTFGYGLSSF